MPLGQGGAVILRRYQHGGLFGRVLGPIFWGPRRALRELQVTSRARKLGAPVPAVGCLVLWPRLGPLWSGIIGTFEESGARDLYEHLLALPAGTPRCHLARRTGAAIRRLPEAGVAHAALQLRNILAVPDPEQERLVIIDLDRAAFGAVAPLDVRRCAQNLGRLGRSLVKNGLWGREVGMREFAHLVAGYTEGNRKLRRELTRWIHWEAAKLRAHRISYPLRSAFGRRAPSPPRRA